MMREDALLSLKEAEEKRNRIVEQAKKRGEENLSKAKREAMLKIEKGKKEALDLRDTLLEARVQKIDGECRLVRERGVRSAERLKGTADENKTEAITHLMSAFERDLDV